MEEASEQKQGQRSNAFKAFCSSAAAKSSRADQQQTLRKAEKEATLNAKRAEAFHSMPTVEQAHADAANVCTTETFSISSKVPACLPNDLIAEAAVASSATTDQVFLEGTHTQGPPSACPEVVV